MDREHARFSVVIGIVQLPPLQTGVVVVRLWVPVVSQVPLNPPQDDQGVLSTEPQERPEVSREHARLSLVLDAAQLPDWQA